MKTKVILSLITAIYSGIFFTQSSYAASDTTTTSENTASNSNENPQNQKDGEILAVLVVVNKNEIAAANEALKKSSSPAVKKYAEMLKKEHTKNLKQTMAVSKKTGIAPVETDKTNSLKEEGKKELDNLSTLNNKEFDKAYIDAMVNGHTKVLETLDDDLIKNASNAALKKQLLATRPHIVAHLNEAKKLQQKLS